MRTKFPATNDTLFILQIAEKIAYDKKISYIQILRFRKNLAAWK